MTSRSRVLFLEQIARKLWFGKQGEYVSRVEVRGRRDGRTGVDRCNILEWRQEEHEYNSHAEDLDSPSGHVEHESLHRKRLRWRNGEVPSSTRLQGFI